MAAYANRFGPHAAADVAASAGLVDDLGQRLTAPSSGGLATLDLQDPVDLIAAGEL